MPGDTAIVTLTHLEEAYYDHLESADGAAGANVNPLQQPVDVVPTVEGGLGAFAALSFDRDTVFVGR